MNEDRTQGMWKQFKGKIREQWGKLTNDEVDQVEGKWDQLSGLIQERYGKARDEVDLEVRRFRDTYERTDTEATPRM